MERTTWRLCEYKFTPIVVSEESISLTGTSLKFPSVCSLLSLSKQLLQLLILCLLLRLYTEEELPPEFKLFIPSAPGTASRGGRKTVSATESIQASVDEEHVEVFAFDDAALDEDKNNSDKIGATETDENMVMPEIATSQTSLSSPPGDVSVSS